MHVCACVCTHVITKVCVLCYAQLCCTQLVLLSRFSGLIMGKANSKNAKSGEEKDSTSTLLAELSAQRPDVWLRVLDNAMTRPRTRQLCRGEKDKLLLLLMASSRVTHVFRGASGSLAIRTVASYLAVDPMDNVYAVLQTPQTSIECFQAQVSPDRRQSEDISEMRENEQSDKKFLRVLRELVDTDVRYLDYLGTCLQVLIYPLEDLNHRRPCPLYVLARALEMIVHVQQVFIVGRSETVLTSNLQSTSLRALRGFRTALPLMQLAYSAAIKPLMDLVNLEKPIFQGQNLVSGNQLRERSENIFGPRPPKRKRIQHIFAKANVHDGAPSTFSAGMLGATVTGRVARYPARAHTHSPFHPGTCTHTHPSIRVRAHTHMHTRTHTRTHTIQVLHGALPLEHTPLHSHTHTHTHPAPTQVHTVDRGDDNKGIWLQAYSGTAWRMQGCKFKDMEMMK